MFRKALILMLALEGLSLLSFKFDVLSLPLLILIGLATFLISLKNLEWGIYILFGELFIGSRGRLLEFDFISLRMVVFGAVLGAWAIRGIMNYELGIRGIKAIIPDSRFLILYILLLLSIVWGVMQGVMQNNVLINIFLDANGYLYLLVLPAVLAGIKTREALENLLKILAAAVLVIGAKTLVLFLWFAYGWPGVATLYHWVIQKDIGEITGIVGSASRIFMQSQFYSLVGLFIFSLVYHNSSYPPLTLRGGTESAPSLKVREGRGELLVVAAAVLAIIISLSRSFWLGGIAGAVFLGSVWIFYLKQGWGRLGRLGGLILLIILVEVGALVGFAKLGSGISQSVLSRGLNPAAEAAGGARLLLLPELLDEIKENPIIGKGFGEEVTYKSHLPDRITPENPDGEITSFAFEWGYLDIMLKIGLIGALIYLFFIAHIFKQGWSKLKAQSSNVKTLGVLSGLVALVVLNVTTPYLNHPLGIGYLILALVSFRIISTATPTFSPPHEGENERGS